MIYIGIDVAKDKHDCFITNSDSKVLFKAFTILNNLDGFNDLYQKIESVMDDVTKVKERAKLKTSVSRLVCILFPELEKLVPTLHMASVYALLSEFPSAKHVATAHLTRLTNLPKVDMVKILLLLSEILQELLSAQICQPNLLN